MKRTISRQELMAAATMLAVVLTLSLGIFVSNRLLSSWLVGDALESSLRNWTESDLRLDARQGREPEDLSSALLRLRSFSQSFVPHIAGVDDGTLHIFELTRFADTVTGDLGSSAMRAHARVPLVDGTPADESGSIVAQEIPAAIVDAGISSGAVRHALEQARDGGLPRVTVFYSWWGAAKDVALVTVPVSDGSTVSSVDLLALDIAPVLAGANRTVLLTTGLLAVLTVSSALAVGLLLWFRYRDVVRISRNMEFLAHHDPLTSLPNRALFSAKLTEALRVTHAKASNMAVILIDVDKFKSVNDTYGHGTGDIFLQVIADRLRAVFGEHLVARLSGDEFAVMVTSISDVARITKLASDMIAATKPPCVIDGIELQISLSMGIARANDGNWRSSRMLHCADLALYRAKHSGRSTFFWYQPEMDAEAQRRKEVEAGLIKALKYDQFDLLYQPQFSLHDNTLKGYEALIRWEHPTKGTISPDVFISVAEDTGLIEDIGDWVLRRACREAAEWHDKTLRVAVNFSPAQFKAGETQRKVARALEESGLDPKRLEIEITESLLIADTDAVVETLEAISSMGVTIAMDDFGTGYSSLSYLNRFPFNKIKIDRSFIKNLGKDAGTDAVVTSIIGLGRSLDVLITAEGVENQDQVVLLRAAGCDLVQGYLFGRPGAVKGPEVIDERALPAGLEEEDGVREPAEQMA
ncbi:bifunctional diguanylate cyclase/phosphodiesterase [Pannonibacter sp. Pt2]|uniref:Bifunctional diguanylate cyclase/phosphodiesterase n=1 Tax=Pannonibacter anstelovis TaxID=3121537 RepID=A0ABU7ZTL7_9HYPH